MCKQDSSVSFYRTIWAICRAAFRTGTRTKHKSQNRKWQLQPSPLSGSLATWEVVLILSHWHVLSSCRQLTVWAHQRRRLRFSHARVFNKVDHILCLCDPHWHHSPRPINFQSLRLLMTEKQSLNIHIVSIQAVLLLLRKCRDDNQPDVIGVFTPLDSFGSVAAVAVVEWPVKVNQRNVAAFVLQQSDSITMVRSKWSSATPQEMKK